MANDILLISGESGFMMKSMVRNLTDNGFDVELIAPSMTTLASKVATDEGSAFMILMYAGDYLNTSRELLSFIKDLCEQQGKMFCVIGYQGDFIKIKETVPEHLISCEIKRPFAMADLVDKIKKSMAAGVSASRKKLILMVDDDVVFLKTMERWLSINYEVVGVKSGTLAISYLATNTPDLILLDFEMPVLSGPQVMQTIRAETNCTDVPIIFLTGKADKESVMQVMALKPQGYILKSSTQADVLNTVDKYFAKHPAKTNDKDVMLM